MSEQSTISFSRFVPVVQPILSKPMSLNSLESDYKSYLSSLDDYRRFSNPNAQRNRRNGDPSLGEAREAMALIVQKLEEITLLKLEFQKQNLQNIVTQPPKPSTGISRPKTPKKPQKPKLSKPAGRK